MKRKAHIPEIGGDVKTVKNDPNNSLLKEKKRKKPRIEGNYEVVQADEELDIEGLGY